MTRFKKSERRENGCSISTFLCLQKSKKQVHPCCCWLFFFYFHPLFFEDTHLLSVTFCLFIDFSLCIDHQARTGESLNIRITLNIHSSSGEYQKSFHKQEKTAREHTQAATA